MLSCLRNLSWDPANPIDLDEARLAILVGKLEPRQDSSKDDGGIVHAASTLANLVKRAGNADIVCADASVLDKLLAAAELVGAAVESPTAGLVHHLAQKRWGSFGPVVVAQLRPVMGLVQRQILEGGETGQHNALGALCYLAKHGSGEELLAAVGPVGGPSAAELAAQEKAATAIQARQRGKRSRRGKKKAQMAEEYGVRVEAAKRIQALERGKQARRQREGKRSASSDSDEEKLRSFAKQVAVGPPIDERAEMLWAVLDLATDPATPADSRLLATDGLACLAGTPAAVALLTAHPDRLVVAPLVAVLEAESPPSPSEPEQEPEPEEVDELAALLSSEPKVEPELEPEPEPEAVDEEAALRSAAKVLFKHLMANEAAGVVLRKQFTSFEALQRVFPDLYPSSESEDEDAEEEAAAASGFTVSKQFTNFKDNERVIKQATVETKRSTMSMADEIAERVARMAMTDALIAQTSSDPHVAARLPAAGALPLLPRYPGNKPWVGLRYCPFNFIQPPIRDDRPQILNPLPPPITRLASTRVHLGIRLDRVPEGRMSPLGNVSPRSTLGNGEHASLLLRLPPCLELPAGCAAATSLTVPGGSLTALDDGPHTWFGLRPVGRVLDPAARTLSVAASRQARPQPAGGDGWTDGAQARTRYVLEASTRRSLHNSSPPHAEPALCACRAMGPAPPRRAIEALAPEPAS